MKLKNLLSAVLFAGSYLSSFSQTTAGNYSIKGLLADSASQKPLDYITVSLKTAAGQPLKSALSKSDGSFLFDKIAAGKYNIAIVAVGYKKSTIPVTVDSAKQIFDMGKITISAESKQLGEVVITADRPLIRQEVDRIAYDVQADPESKIQNVLDMMRKVPLLSLDGDDEIKLKGSSNYKILINGRPSSLVARNPKDVFRSMPASSIQKIEVITTPPAKYDSEGLAGIINIITNKKIDNGYNGSININERFPVGGPGAGGSFTVKQGKFGISGYGGISLYNQPETSSFSNRTTTGNIPTNLSQNGIRESENRFNYFGSELSFEIDSLNLITGEFGLNGGKYDVTSNQLSVLNAQNEVMQGYNLYNNGKSNWNGLDMSINYQLGFKKSKERLLTFSYDYEESTDGQFNSIEIFDRVEYNTPDYQQVNDGRSTEQTFQVDYVHPVKKLNIEAGVKGILRVNKSDFQYQSFNSPANEFEVVDSLSNNFINNQDIFGAYNSYQYNLKNWGFKAGLRLEQTVISADFISNASQIDQNYFNLIPSVSVNRKFKNMSNLNFGYTQRIQRPNIYTLNPFVDRSNPNFESTGNPNLRPVLNNNLTFGYSKFKKGSVNLGLSYSFANNTVQRISVFDPASNITRSTFQNIGKNKSLGSNFNVNYPITKKMNFNISGNLNYIWIEGVVKGELSKNDGIQGYFYASTGYKFEKEWRVNSSISYHSQNITLQGGSNANLYSSFSLSKDIVKDKLTFSASTNNPFTKFRNYRTETTGDNFIANSNFQNYNRSFSTSLNYRFGKLKDEIKKNKRGIKNDDTSGGGNSNRQ